MKRAPANKVLFLLALAAIATCLFAGFLTEAPNRLVTGKPLALWQALGTPVLLAAILATGALLVLSWLRQSATVLCASLFAAGALLFLLFFAAGEAAGFLMKGARPAQRIGLGAGFWAAAFCLVMAMIDAAQRLKLGPAGRLLVATSLLLPLAAMARWGIFDQLSLLREYAAQRDAFAAQAVRHCALVAAAVAAALACGVPLGLLVARRPHIAGAVFGTLNLLQTIPSIALFGLLIAPFSALAAAVPGLGIAGIGAAPAIVALMLYALLPVARNTQAGIAAADPAIIEAARAMGFTPRQILWRVELPLGAPVFIAGLRIVLVQAIGLAAVAALVGAGGFGSFIFQGIGQYATDLVLLGAIPTILLALAADFVLGIAAQLLLRKESA